MRWFVRTYTQRDNADKPIKDPDELLLVGLAGSENARWHSLSDQFRFLINDLYPDVLKYDPDDWRAEWHIGMLLLEKYNRPEANQAFDNALKINPKAAEAFVGKGQVALQQFETKDADGHADQALKINPRLTSALRLKADVHAPRRRHRGRPQVPGPGPRGESRATSRPSPASRPARRILNKPDDVKAIIAEVEKFNPKPGLFYHELASSLEDRKIYGDAEVYFKKSIELRESATVKLARHARGQGRARHALHAARQGGRGEGPARTGVQGRHLQRPRRRTRSRCSATSRSTRRSRPSTTTCATTRSTDKLLAEFMAEYLETVHAQLAKDFQYEPEGRILIELFNNHEMFSGRTVGLPDLHTIGACTGKVVTIASPKGKGVRTPFNWGRVIRHELVHIFNLAQTDFLVPALADRRTGRPQRGRQPAAVVERSAPRALREGRPAQPRQHPARLRPAAEPGRVVAGVLPEPALRRVPDQERTASNRSARC